jgi:hypothetical protein
MIDGWEDRGCLAEDELNPPAGAALAGMNQLACGLEPQVVHSLPGRVRLRFGPKQSEEALAIARQLGQHPAVSSVRWSPKVRSLAIEFEPGLSFREVLQNLPYRGDLQRRPAVTTPRLDWGRITMACFLALVPMGPAGSVAVALAAEVVGQVHDRSARPADSLAGLRASADIGDIRVSGPMRPT